MYIKRTTRGSKLFSYLPRGQTRTFYLFSDKAPCVGWTWDCVYARLFNFDGVWKTPARMGSDLMMMMMERGSRRANRFANTAELQSNIRGQSELSAINKNSSPGRWQSKKWNAKCQRAIWGLCVGHVPAASDIDDRCMVKSKETRFIGQPIRTPHSGLPVLFNINHTEAHYLHW